MSTRLDIDSLYSFSITDLRKFLLKGGHTLGELEDILSSPKSFAEGIVSWSIKDRSTAESRVTNRSRIEIRKDGYLDLLYLEFVYSLQRGEDIGEEERVRYYLQRKESNLKPGYYRYYFLDPYTEETPGLCSKLYLYEGRIVPRSVLKSYGLIYKQQREGHLQRYVWSYYHRVPDWESMKYRKSHYRGKETPIWRRYLSLSEEADRRVLSVLLSSGMVDYTDLLPETRR